MLTHSHAQRLKRQKGEVIKSEKGPEACDAVSEVGDGKDGGEGGVSDHAGQVQIESDLDTVSSLEPTPDEIEISQRR